MKTSSVAHSNLSVRTTLFVSFAFIVFAVTARATDWPMFGRDNTRNAVSPEKNPPIEWDIRTGKNIKWKAKLGSW